MTFTIITHVPHKIEQNQYFAYSPYVREMNIWAKFVDNLILVAPKTTTNKTAIDSNYEHQKIEFIEIKSFDFLNLKALFDAVFKIPKICFQIFKAMQTANHIHLRCPGNIGLLACFVQILFPNKPKTAKYAGNWDPNSKQPISYQLQKWLLSNTFLTRNMQVLVYGEWQNQSKNIKPFFTATYSESDKLPLKKLSLNEKINFVFVGTLSVGKNPLYAIQLVENLFSKRFNVQLTIFGEGNQRTILEDYIYKNNLKKIVTLHGNQSKEIVKKAYQGSHFVILPSKSEGWPKAIAEGMFWGCIPVATRVSCVPFMLDFGKQGILLDNNLEKDASQIESIIEDKNHFENIREKASNWSRKYTIDVFENEIYKLLKNE